MKKKCYKILGLLSMCLLLGIAHGCTDAETSKALKDAEYTLSVKEETLELIVGDTFLLGVEYDKKAGETLTFTSSDPDVVSVNEAGLLTAHTLGSSKITVGYAGKTNEVSVQATFGEFVPQMYLEQIQTETLTVYKGEKLNVNGYVTFNGKIFTDGEFRYTIAEPAFATVEDGIVTAGDKVGETELLVQCNWRGFGGALLTQRYTLKVLNNVLLNVDIPTDKTIELYSTARAAGKEFANTYKVKANCYDNGIEVADGELVYEIKDGADCLTFDETTKTLTGKKAGTATFSVTYTDDAGASYTEEFCVNVLRPVIDYEQTLVFDAYLGELPLTDIFGETVVLTSAAGAGDETLTIQDNKVKGVKVTSATPTERVITVYTDTVGVNVTVKAYSRIIRTANDLAYFRYSADTANAFDGYYILANNIDASGYTHDPKGTLGGEVAGNAVAGTGLTGTFDGQGYTIDGITFGQYNGLFGMLSDNGKVKNLGLTNVQFKYSGWNAVIAFSAKQTKSSLIPALENVYIQADELKGNHSGGVFQILGTAKLTMHNVLIEIDTKSNDTVKSYGSFTARHGKFTETQLSNMQFVNAYIISAIGTTCYESAERWAEAENVDITGVTVGGVDVSQMKWHGLYRYDTAENMQKANLDLSGFDNAYWQIANGIPVWKTAQ